MNINNIIREYLSDETPMPKEIRRSGDVRIDMSQILEQKAYTEPGFFAERHARKLFVPAAKKDPADMVWLRIRPQGDQIEYFLADPRAHDLARCQRIFAYVIAFSEKTGCLSDFAAPSFPGKRAVTLLRNLMAITQLETLILIDGATSLACCSDGALTNIRSMGAFIYGKGWYEMQGATAKIAFTTFRLFNSDNDDDDEIDPRLAQIKDFEQSDFQSNLLGFTEYQPSPQAYKKACSFLRSLPIKKLKNSLVTLSRAYPRIQQLQEILSKASPSSITVGHLLKETGSHDLVHQVRDSIVSNKDSVFFQYITDTLQAKSASPEILGALAWCVLRTVFDYLIDTHPDKKAVEMLQKLFRSESEPLDSLVTEVRQKILKLIEEENSPPCVKICSHSTSRQRADSLQYETELGTSRLLLAVQSAFCYLQQLSLTELQATYPQLATTLANRFAMAPHTTIGDLLASSANQWVLSELIFGAYKHISRLFIRALSTSRDAEYPLFMLAKYIVARHKQFFMFQ